MSFYQSNFSWHMKLSSCILVIMPDTEESPADREFCKLDLANGQNRSRAGLTFGLGPSLFLLLGLGGLLDACLSILDIDQCRCSGDNLVTASDYLHKDLLSAIKKNICIEQVQMSLNCRSKFAKMYLYSLHSKFHHKTKSGHKTNRK